jgi:hypothetical protein
MLAMSGIVRTSDSANQTCYKTLRIAECKTRYYFRDRSSWEEDKARQGEMVGDQTNQARDPGCNLRRISRAHQGDYDH